MTSNISETLEEPQCENNLDYSQVGDFLYNSIDSDDLEKKLK